MGPTTTHVITNTTTQIATTLKPPFEVPVNTKCNAAPDRGSATPPAQMSKCKALGCGDNTHDQICWCNTKCKQFGNCCPDYDEVCAADVSFTANAGDAPIPWESSGEQVGSCGVDKPKAGWRLDNYCSHSGEVPTLNGSHAERFLRGIKGSGSNGDDSTQIKVLTYNLFWWNLFDKGKSEGGIAGKNIAASAKEKPFDLMGFQECEDVTWPLRDAKEAGMVDEFTTIVNDHATAIAYRTAVFEKISQGGKDVTEDLKPQKYGTRGAYWVRLLHKPTGRKVFFMNHHGPTPINTGGTCGQEGVAYKLLKMIAENAKQGDAMILVGDFNVNWLDAMGEGKFRGWRDEPAFIDCHFRHDFANPTIDDMWGLDNFYSACVKQVKGTVMDKGGSDHYALNFIYDISR